MRWLRPRRTTEPENPVQQHYTLETTLDDNRSSLRRYSPFLLVVALLSLFLVSTAVLEAYRYTADAFATSGPVGYFFTTLFVALGLALIWWLWRSLAEFRRIRNIGRLRSVGRGLSQRGHDPELSADIDRYVDSLAVQFAGRPELSGQLEHIRRRLLIQGASRPLSGREQVGEISCVLFAELDRRAASIVVLRSQQTALLAAVSRLPFLDLVISLWRSLALVKEIAALYGGRPGMLGTMALMRSTLYAVVFADVSQVAADGLAQTLGDRVLSTLSAQAAQGVGLGLMIGRLGLQAINQCRPVPFTGTEDSRPSFRMLSRAMTDLARQALIGRKSQARGAVEGDAL